MCKEAFRNCTDYLERSLSEAANSGRLPSSVISDTKKAISQVRGILDRPDFDVNKVEPIINKVKDRLFMSLLKGRCDILQGDITNQNSDAIVNAANTQLILGGGVAGAIRARGGAQVQMACDNITNGRTRPIELGRVATTTGGKIGPKIIHAAVMELGGRATPESVRRATRNIVLEAKQNGFRSISIPALGAGAGGVSALESARAIQKGLYDMVLELASFDKINIVAFDPQTQKTFMNVFSMGIGQ